MGNALKSGVRTVQRFNAESRAHRLLDKEKVRSAPRHPTTAGAIQELQQKNPDVLHEQQKKNEKLAEFLQDIRVDSTDPEESVPDAEQPSSSQTSQRPLPTNRRPNPEPVGLFEVPDVIPEGRLSIPMAIEMLTKHKRNPKEWPVARLAEDYRLDPIDAKNILEHFKSLKVIPIQEGSTSPPTHLLGR